MYRPHPHKLDEVSRQGRDASPLEADDVQEGAPSDHLISFVKASLPKVMLLGQRAVRNKAVTYQRKIQGALESFLPLITVRRKSTDPPWINTRVQRISFQLRTDIFIGKEVGGNHEWSIRRVMEFIHTPTIARMLTSKADLPLKDVLYLDQAYSDSDSDL